MQPDEYDDGMSSGCLGITGGSAAALALSLAIGRAHGFLWGLAFYLSALGLFGLFITAEAMGGDE